MQELVFVQQLILRTEAWASRSLIAAFRHNFAATTTYDDEIIQWASISLKTPGKFKSLISHTLKAKLRNNGWAI